MALYAPAEKRLLPPGVNHSSGGMGAIMGVIVHVIVGSLAAADGLFHTVRDQGSSAHLGVDYDGRVVQWVDTHDKAWAQAAGNPYWISVETAGRPENPLTPQQVAALGRIVAWARSLYGFPLRVTDSPTQPGIGTHQMGGGAWGAHACPGAIRASQRPAIIAAAQGTVPVPPPQEDEVPAVHLCHAKGDLSNARVLTDRLTRRWVKDQKELDHLIQKEHMVDEEWEFVELAQVPWVGEHP